MTRRRWIADEYSDSRAALTGAHASHLARTLRARVGQEFEVACGDIVRHATISRVTDERVEFTLGEEVSATSAVPITLLLAIFKFDRMEWAIEKCTELNVTTIVPVIARRTEKHLAHSADRRVERWRRIAREASEQSRRTSPPEITPPIKLKEAFSIHSDNQSALAQLSDKKPEIEKDGSSRLRSGATSGGTCCSPGPAFNPSLAEAVPVRSTVSHTHRTDKSAFPNEGFEETREEEPRRGGIEVSPGREPWVAAQNESSPAGTAQTRVEDRLPDAANGCHIVLAESERDIMLTDILRAHDPLQSLTLAIGPEGGWTTDELQLFADAHWTLASLGETILRAETAAIAALAIARAEI